MPAQILPLTIPSPPLAALPVSELPHAIGGVLSALRWSFTPDESADLAEMMLLDMPGPDFLLRRHGVSAGLRAALEAAVARVRDAGVHRIRLGSGVREGAERAWRGLPAVPGLRPLDWWPASRF